MKLLVSREQTPAAAPRQGNRFKAQFKLELSPEEDRLVDTYWPGDKTFGGDYGRQKGWTLSRLLDGIKVDERNVEVVKQIESELLFDVRSMTDYLADALAWPEARREEFEFEVYGLGDDD